MEKRGLKRRHLIYFLRVFNAQNQELLGHIVNLNSKGLMLISEQQLPLAPFELRMDLPESMFNTENIQFQGESIWSKPDVNPDFYVTGFRLSGLSDHKRLIMEKLIQDFGFEDR